VRRSPRPLITTVAALVLAASLAACAFDPLHVTASGTQELDVVVTATAPDLRVRVEMFNGPIEVHAGVPGRVTATVTTTGEGSSKADAEADRAQIQVTLDANPDGSVLLRAVYQPNPGSPNNRAASAVVDVPPGAALDLVTSNGDVTTAGVAGPVGVTTSNGVVTLAGAAQGATVRTSNKHVDVEGAGLVDVETSNGMIAIRATLATVAAHTSNAQIAFEGTLSDQPQSMETSNERIDVRLSADASFGLDARTSNAEVRVEGFTVRTAGADSGATLQGTVGTGGPSITLRTSNNPITVSAQ
jgi:hypothetical protein